MADEISEDVDLFGNPWRAPKDQRGRKRHKWTQQVAENIAVLRATGLNHEQVADRVGLDPKTMRKYYSRELDNGAVLAKAMVDEVMFKKAMAGVVGAARYVRESFELGQAKRVASAPRQAKAETLGVKAERQKKAAGVGGLYATPQPPRSVQ